MRIIRKFIRTLRKIAIYVVGFLFLANQANAQNTNYNHAVYLTASYYPSMNGHPEQVGLTVHGVAMDYPISEKLPLTFIAGGEAAFTLPTDWQKIYWEAGVNVGIGYTISNTELELYTQFGYSAADDGRGCFTTKGFRVIFFSKSKVNLFFDINDKTNFMNIFMKNTFIRPDTVSVGTGLRICF